MTNKDATKEVKVSTYLTQEDYESLLKQAETEQRTVSGLMRLALTMYIKQHSENNSVLE